MTERLTQEKLHGPVHEHMRTDFVQLHPDLTVAQALELILEKQSAGRIIYFYVSDGDGRVTGSGREASSGPSATRPEPRTTSAAPA